MREHTWENYVAAEMLELVGIDPRFVLDQGVSIPVVGANPNDKDVGEMLRELPATDPTSIFSDTTIDLPVTTDGCTAVITGLVEFRRLLYTERFRLIVELDEVAGIFQVDRSGRGRLHAVDVTQSTDRLVVAGRAGSSLTVFGPPVVVSARAGVSPVDRRFRVGFGRPNPS